MELSRKISFFKVFVSLMLATILIVGSVVTAHAKTVYYPTSGTASGVCTNAKKSSVAVYSLKGGYKYTINYTLTADRTMQIRFYHNSSLDRNYDAATITNNPDGGVTEIDLSKYTGTATYYVVVCPKNDSAATYTYAYVISL